MGYFTKSNSLLGRISLRNLFTWWENGRAPGAEKSVPGLNLPPESKGGSPSETILEEVTLRDGGRGVGHVVGTEAPTLLFPRVSCGTHRTSDPSEERRWEQWGRRGASAGSMLCGCHASSDPGQEGLFGENCCSLDGVRARASVVPTMPEGDPRCHPRLPSLLDGSAPPVHCLAEPFPSLRETM